ncbi:hypothetical protein BBD39_06120 [Arsenophonus endosymbiont of Bemisia tabaci Asia II 3]|nr:hypothetical protein BBD39_06120 [Arsenophonus endosymbiont of Bemisia tabaci Asia II 3]
MRALAGEEDFQTTSGWLSVRSSDFRDFFFFYGMVEKSRGWGDAYVNSILMGIVDAIFAVAIGRLTRISFKLLVDCRCLMLLYAPTSTRTLYSKVISRK